MSADMKNRMLYGWALLCLCLVGSSMGQVTFERLVNSAKEPQNWLTYSGDYAGRRYSALDEVNANNAPSLVAKWVYQTAATGKFETTPVVVDGILYATGPDDRAFALDARTGRLLWTYQRQLPGDIRPCCGRINRGVAVLGDKVFLGTLDAHVMALDAKTGNVVWDVVAADYREGYSFSLAPLAVKDTIILGVSGGEYGIRGFIDAYDPNTGKRKWRFDTVPGPGQARGRPDAGSPSPRMAGSSRYARRDPTKRSSGSPLFPRAGPRPAFPSPPGPRPTPSPQA